MNMNVIMSQYLVQLSLAEQQVMITIMFSMMIWDYPNILSLNIWLTVQSHMISVTEFLLIWLVT